MVTSGDRRGGNPIIVHHDGSKTQSKRIPLTKQSFVEGWPQELIRSNPELLPVAEIEPAFSPLVAIGREVQTSAGSIDIMFMNPRGYLTIVETKLWRNPQARREAVAQIIDYAKDVSRWTFEELEDSVRKYNQKYRKSNLGLLDTLRIDEAEEKFIIDAITRNLKLGRFLLLIVGDGIRENVEDLVDFLQRNPQLLFTLALVELQVHELDHGGSRSRLVVPQVVARTREIIRAVVKVEDKAIESIHITGMDTDIDRDKRKTRQRNTLTADDFFKLLAMTPGVGEEDVEFAKQILDDMERYGYTIKLQESSFMVWLPDPCGSDRNLTLFGVKLEGKVYVRWLPGQLRKCGLPRDIGVDFVKDSAHLFNDNINPKDDSVWKRDVPLSELREKYSEFTSILQRTVDRIIRASNKSEGESNSEGKR